MISYCANCGVSLEENDSKCPKCGLLKLKDLSGFVKLASGDISGLLDKFEKHVKNPSKSDIEQYLQEAQDWRKDNTFKEEYVKGSHKVLHYREDGDIDVRVVEDFGSVEKVRKANPQKVYYWTAAAAEKGSVKALRELASYKLCGFGCKRGTINAIAMFACAAMCGDKDAYLTLINGEIKDEHHVGLSPDEAESNLTRVEFWQKKDNVVAELEQFAAANMLWAKYLLGVMYLRGLRVEKDVMKGIALILGAAEKGPSRVERAMKDKALLQFDKLIDLNGRNNVDAAFETYWKMKYGVARTEAFQEMIGRTSFADSNKQGCFLLRKAARKFKETNNCKWITLPESYDECNTIDKGLGGSYHPIGSYMKDIKSGKTYRIFAPFLGKNGIFGACGLWLGWNELTGNLRYKFEPAIAHMGTATRDELIPEPRTLTVMPTVKKIGERGVKYIDWCVHCWGDNPINFEPAGFSEADLLALIDYVRRYVFSDLVAGIHLVDGSIQKEQSASKIDLPKEPSNYSLSILKQVGAANSIQSAKMKPKDVKTIPCASNTSNKRRWKYILLGILFGWLGAHYMYAKRWGLFALHVAAFVGLLVAPPLGLLWLVTWFGGTFFVKKDGKGNRLK